MPGLLERWYYTDKNVFSLQIQFLIFTFQTGELTMLNFHYFVNYFDLCVKWLDSLPMSLLLVMSVVSSQLMYKVYKSYIV